MSRPAVEILVDELLSESYDSQLLLRRQRQAPSFYEVQLDRKAKGDTYAARGGAFLTALQNLRNHVLLAD